MGFTNTKEINKEEDVDYRFRLLFIGDNGVGKTSLILRFSEDTFSDVTDFQSFDGTFKMVNRTIDGDQVNLHIREAPQQQKFRSFNGSHYRHVLGIFIVYDVTNPDSLKNIDKYHFAETNSYGDEMAQKFLIGNKCDLVNDRIVSYDDAKEYADELGINFLETSAKDSTNVTFAFEQMTKKIINYIETT